MIGDEVYDILLGGESQTVEFKTSLASQEEAIQTMVAFANAQGGRVFFGVQDDGRATGVSIGKNTLENLSISVSDHTYPSLPVVVEDAFQFEGRTILSVEVPADVPPMIGVYLYSNDTIPLHEPIPVEKLQAYRRVGRTNQKEDFMRMRQPLDTEPRVIMYLDRPGSRGGTPFPMRQDIYYSNSGSGWAFDVTFEAHNDFYELEASPKGITLPPWDQEDPLFRANRRRGKFQVLNPSGEPQGYAPVRLIATYADEHGLIWESGLELPAVPSAEDVPDFRYFIQGRFWRRVNRFPAKSEM